MQKAQGAESARAEAPSHCLQDAAGTGTLAIDASSVRAIDAHAASLKHDGATGPANVLKSMKRAITKYEAAKLHNKLAKAKGK